MNTTLSLGFGVGMTCPWAGRRWVISFAKYPAARSSVMSFSLTEEAIHLPCAPHPDMVECFLEVEKMRTWALELENGRAEREKVWVKEGESLSPYKGGEYQAPPLALKVAYSHGVVGTTRLDYPNPY